MAPWRHRIIYFLLLPAIALSAGILGYYTWFTASRFTRLGEQTIAENTLLLVREKVETIEQYTITPLEPGRRTSPPPTAHTPPSSLPPSAGT